LSFEFFCFDRKDNHEAPANNNAAVAAATQATRPRIVLAADLSLPLGPTMTWPVAIVSSSQPQTTVSAHQNNILGPDSVGEAVAVGVCDERSTAAVGDGAMSQSFWPDTASTRHSSPTPQNVPIMHVQPRLCATIDRQMTGHRPRTRNQRIKYYS
jgi:hypothetical protein